MKNTSKYKVDIGLFLCIVFFAIISVVTIGSAETLLQENNHLIIRQIIWYSIGFIIIYFIMFVGNHFLYKNAWILYIIGVLSLILLLFFGTTINDAKCWFKR